MKTRSAVLAELKRVRELLAVQQCDGDDTDLMYGAQQALVWILGEGAAPSYVGKVIEQLCESEQDHG
jgi:hypothetical protein